MSTPDIRPLRVWPHVLDQQRVTQAIETNLAEFWLALGRTPGGEVHEDDRLRWAYSGSPYLNRVVATKLDKTSVDEQIKQVLGIIRKREAAVTWFVGPSDRPNELSVHLERHGFANLSVWKGMAHHFDAPEVMPTTSSNFKIQPVDGSESLGQWLEIACRGFQLPRRAGSTFAQFVAKIGLNDASSWRYYLGYLDGRPVATSTLFIDKGVAGIYLVATVPEARGKGVGTMLTRATLDQARRCSCNLAVLHATEASRRMYERLDFRTYCEIGLYRWQPPRPLWKRAGAAWRRRFRHESL